MNETLPGYRHLPNIEVVKNPFLESVENPWANIIFASNRLPLTVKEKEDGWIFQHSSGGLVAALRPITHEPWFKGKWVGWTATRELPGLNKAISAYTAGENCQYVGLGFTAEEEEFGYNGYVNEILWPLVHDLTSYWQYKQEDREKYWPAYEQINEKFAQNIIENSNPEDLILVQDIHLLLTARKMREKGSKQTISLFVHTPLPSLSSFSKLPESEKLALIDGLLAFDSIGLQTPEDLRHLVTLVHAYRPGAAILETPNGFSIQGNGHKTLARAIPISIDAAKMASDANSEKVLTLAQKVREEKGREFAFNSGRSDITKGFLEGMYGFELALARYPYLREKQLMQLVIPSREKVSYTGDLKNKIDYVTARINSKYPNTVDTQHRGMIKGDDDSEYLGHYRAARMQMVPSLQDGMNLIAKEYAVAGPADGVLAVSKHAGAAQELAQSAIIFDPNDVEDTAESYHTAFEMPEPIRRAKMDDLARQVLTSNIDVWRNSVLDLSREAFNINKHIL